MNPLAHIPKDELLRRVDTFAEEKNMMDIQYLLQKGNIIHSSSASWPATYGPCDVQVPLSPRVPQNLNR